MPDDITGAELAEVIQGIRDRVRARYPEGLAAAGVPLADLTPAVHARDAAEAKVAAIGSVNPRPAGLVHGVVQAVKKTVARALDWHVREQVEFNRAALRALDATVQALNETNRALQALAQRDEEFAARAAELAAQSDQRIALLSRRVEELLEVRDIRTHWAEWRLAWEQKLAEIEKHFFRAVSDLHGAYQNRATVLETSVRETTRIQHSDFLAALDDGLIQVQKKLRDDFERLIRLELRVIRQRTMLPQLAAPPTAVEPVAAAPEGPPLIDWLHFASRFRGSEESVREKQRFYLPYFAKCREAALDLGCGRGEFLELMREAGAPARGVDLSAESVALCRSKGLNAEVADLFGHMRALPDNSLDGVFCAQVIEHIPPSRVPELLHLIAAKLDRGGVVALETPNPDCLAIFATHFYLDPTHIHPTPSKLLKFYLEEFGMDRIEVHLLNPAEESWPAVQSLSPEFREIFFGALDYAVIAWKL